MVTEGAFQTTGSVYLQAVWYLPFIYSPRNPTVHIILATYRKFTVATVGFTQNVSQLVKVKVNVIMNLKSN